MINRVVIPGAKLFLLAALPFFALIRGAVFCHAQYDFAPWGALVGGVMLSTSLIFIYILYFQTRLTGKLGTVDGMKTRYWIALLLVLFYCLPGIFYLSAGNAKYPEVREEFTNLHPILRLGVSTLTWLDRDLILTDASRLPEDYRKMGLRKKNQSLHYLQSDGYAHAVDIRTIGHSELRNGLITLYFRLMGFRTLRHTGTADHLHVSLMSHDRREAL